MRILALEPYYGGSHRAFLDGWSSRSRHDWTLLTLPAHKWTSTSASATCSRPWPPRRLAGRGVDFRLSVIGETFREVPEVFAQAKEEFDASIDRWGYQSSRDEYHSVLAERLEQLVILSDQLPADLSMRRFTWSRRVPEMDESIERIGEESGPLDLPEGLRNGNM